MRRSLRAVVCCRIWGEGEPRRRRGRGSPSPPSPPSPPLRAFIREDKIRRDTQSPSSPTCPPGGTSRRPRPDAGPKPQANGRKERKKTSRQESVCTPGPRRRRYSPRQAEASAYKGNAPHRSGDGRKKSPQHQRAGARRRSPQRGSAAAGAHITREAGRCAPIGPLRRAADKVHDIAAADARRHTRQGGVRGS